MQRVNYYILLDLDPTIQDLPTIEAAILAKQREWSTLRTHPSRETWANQNLGSLPAILTLMRDTVSRKAEAHAAKKILSSKEKGKNVFKDSNITAKGNIHIGDVTNNIYHTNPPEKKEGALVDKAKVAKEARKLIAANKIKAAITYLEKETTGLKGTFTNQISQQSALWNKFKKAERIGILTEEQKGVQYNRVVNSLLEIIGELQDE